MWKIVSGAVAISCLVYLIKKHFRGAACHCSTRLDNKVVIITGATSGIGRSLSFLLAHRGANLVLACRNIHKGELVKKQILSETNCRIVVLHLNLNSFKSINEFSEHINVNFRTVYALVNNAGVFYLPSQLTDDGFDLTLQTNYLGPFLLTKRLLSGGTLQRSNDSRVVNISSEAHRLVDGKVLKGIFDQHTLFYSYFEAYGATKLALILFTRALAYEFRGTSLTAYSVNPGNVETDIYRHFPLLSHPLLYAIQWPIRKLVVKSPYEGAQNVLHALLMKSEPSGLYISECKVGITSEAGEDQELISSFYNWTLEVLKGRHLIV